MAPSCVVTVTVAEPAAAAVSLPVASTVTTVAALEAKVTALFVAQAGTIEYSMVAVAPTVSVAVATLAVTDVTGTFT